MTPTNPLPLKPSTTPRTGGRHPVFASVTSAVLLWTTFPPADWGWLAWLSLVPLFLQIPSQRSPRSLYLGAWAGGFVFWTLAIQWVRLSDESAWLGWLTMALVLSSFWPLFLVLARLAFFRLRLPLMIAAPVVWVALEYVRAYFLTGFPWYYLAHSQHLALPVIQISDVTGSLGVSMLIAVVNAWIVDLITLPLLHVTPKGTRLTSTQRIRLVIVLFMLGGTLGYGAFKIGTSHFRDGPRVALLQSSLIQGLKDSKSADELIDVYQRLISRALRVDPRPDLIVWPETSYPYGFVSVAPGLDHGILDRQLSESGIKLSAAQRESQRTLILEQLHGMTNQADVPMLVGSLFSEHSAEGFSKYNAAILFEPRSSAIQVFQKWHLVPFGEYVPLIKTFPWLTVFTPYSSGYVPSLAFGKDSNVLNLGPYKIATAICFEDTVPQVVQRFFGLGKGADPDLLLNLSNDGWFHGSEEHDMHLAVSVFRAVEHRVPLARAVNTGVSAIVDGNGRILAALPKLREEVLIGVIPLDDRRGLYSIWGDWLGRACLAVTIGLVPLSYFRESRKKSLLS